MTDTRVSWDQEADAIYIQLSDAEVASTVSLSSTVYIDLDANGDPVGLEVLRVDESILAALRNLPHTATLRDLLGIAA